MIVITIYLPVHYNVQAKSIILRAVPFPWGWLCHWKCSVFIPTIHHRLSLSLWPNFTLTQYL